MIVPSYVPPPIEIPDNVAEAKIGPRLAFIRTVATLHAASLGLVAGLGALGIAGSGLVSSLAATLAILVAMSLVRLLAKGRKVEVFVSLGMLGPLMVALSLVAGASSVMGWPLWPFALTVALAAAYCWTSGRDMSFVGMYFWSFGLSSCTWGMLAWLGAAGHWPLGIALVVNALWLFYWVYDLAALLTRRRLGEEFGAVADLYRDVLNFSTYWIRLVVHWRRHRIWAK